MVRTISSLVSLFLCLLLVSCEKEFSAENGGITGGGTVGGTALFTLDGAPGDCTSPFLSGTYVAGTATSTSNTVVIAVNVTTPGTYTISTNTANGVSFSGAGEFTTTGLQPIQLTASGTPAAAGTFNFKPGVNFCSFPVSFTASGSGTNTAVFTLNCVTPVFSTGAYTAGTTISGTANTVKLLANVTTAGTYNITTTANGIIFTASGTFTATGTDQTITFVASGTPTAAGTTAFTVGTAGCGFSVPVGAANTSAYTIDCSSANVNTASYTTGVALNGSNTVAYTVDVTAIGSYNIVTSANGMVFTAAGSFTAIGPGQTITFVGSGTPTTAGITSLPFTAGTNNCSFDITVVAGSTGFLKATIDGTATVFNTNLAGTLENVAAGPSELTVDGDISSASGSDNLSLDFVNSTGLINSGNYSGPSITNSSKFVLIGYTDNAGTSWVPNPLSAGAVTCSLTVTATGATATFSGTLNNVTTTGTGIGTLTKVITNGSFSVTF